MNRQKQITMMLAYFVLVGLAFTVFILPAGTTAVHVEDAAALCDFDFEKNIAYIKPGCFEWYPQRLYSPKDFAAGHIEALGTPDDGSARYGTYRLVFMLTPGTVYGLSAYSATYAQTLWIDGVLYSAVGTPGDSLEASAPKTEYYTVYFEAKGETEIIIQRSDFVHAKGGQLYPLHVGEQKLISSMVSRIYMRGFVIVGSMLMAALFFLGIFLFFKERRQFLWFALACILITIRTLSIDHKLIMVMFPNLNWQLSHKLEYLSTIGFLFFFFLYLNVMFGRKVKGRLNIFGILVVCLYFAVVIIAPSTVYTLILPYMHYAALIYVLPTIFLLARGIWKDRESYLPEHILILLGTTVYVVMSLIDLIRYYINDLYQSINLMQIGVVVFVFSNTLALALSFTRTETALTEARRRESDMEETNRLLERLERVRAAFLSNISHEIKTPLTVMSGYAQRALRQIDAGTVNEDTRQGLITVSLEAQRLAMLAEQLLDASMEPVGAGPPRPADLARILERTAALCEPILYKNGNSLQIDIEPACPNVLADEGMILQVLVNLCVNANRHMRDGVVTVSVEKAGLWRCFR